MQIWLDVVVVLLLLVCITHGVKKGGAKSLLGVFSFAVTAILFVLLKKPLQEAVCTLPFVQAWTASVEQALLRVTDTEALKLLFAAFGTGNAILAEKMVLFLVNILVFVLAFILVRLLSKLLTGIADTIMSLPLLRNVNALLGGAIGLLKGCVLVWALMPIIPAVYAAIPQSSVAKLLWDCNIFILLFR